eukprot:TRINITY_DN3777_c0_g1_i2.p1 TRINITY_DN3777_c0_g1~~TRINITY_DN3777_c0_g1_i2.p1  ORF type:complete len:609 (+),score=118.11 TRINITY_DN3777_c0_g1_i2:108-1934(+)
MSAHEKARALARDFQNNGGNVPNKILANAKIFQPGAKSIQLVPEPCYTNDHSDETWPHIPVISIDLGTSRSGIAFGIIPDPQNGQKRVEWKLSYISADSEDPRKPEKSETILIHVPNQRDRIGGTAWLSTFDNQTSDDFLEGYYVRDFKMLMDVKSRKVREGDVQLKKTEVDLIPFDTEVKKTSTMKMSLLEVVSRFLKVCGEIGFQELQRYANGVGWGNKISREDVNWVITIPAIWTDQARIFMREACLNARFLGKTEDPFTSQVGLCLEPEAATLFCFSVFTRFDSMKDKNFLVIDLGGGTADITYHKLVGFSKFSGGCRLELEEVEGPSGGPWGGRLIDQAFRKEILAPLIGERALKELEKREHIWFKFLVEKFWSFKKQFDGKKSFIFDVSHFCGLFDDSFITKEEIIRNIKNLQDKHNCQQIIQRSGRITIPPELIVKMFLPVLQPLRAHLQDLIKRSFPNKGGLAMSFLVGGMAENPYLQTEIPKMWKELMVPYDPQSECFVPPRAGVAIVEGALRFGFDPSPFRMRRARTSYGLSIYNEKDPSKPLFSKVITKNDNLSNLLEITTKTPLGPYGPVTESQTYLQCSLYELSLIHISEPTRPY